MLTAGIFTFIGIGILVIAKSIGQKIELTGIWTEFAGDGIQKIVAIILGFIKKSQDNKKLIVKIKDKVTEIEFTKEDIKQYKAIFKEVKENEYPDEKERKAKGKSTENKNKSNFWGKLKDSLSKFKDTLCNMLRGDRVDVQFISKMSESVLYELDYESFLNELAPNYFAKLNKEKKEKFVKFITLVVDIYRKEVLAKSPEEVKVMASLIVYSLKLYISSVEDKILDKLEDFEKRFEERIEAKFLQILQAGGEINFQSIRLAKYSPRYILNSCPECGYKGPRIYINEKTNMTYCAACGSSYSIVKYCEPELWQEINVKIEELRGASKEIRGASKEIEELLASNNEELKKLVLSGFEQVATKEYLTACMNDNIEFKSSMKIDIEKGFSNFTEQIKGLYKRNENIENIENGIKEINEQNIKYNEFMSMKLDSLGIQINKVYNFAQQEFAGLGIKSDLILQYVQKLFSKEYLEDMSNALGTNFDKAVNFSTEKIVAVNTTGVAQILAAIEDLKKRGNQFKESGKSEDISAACERLICDRTTLLSGQVNGLQELIKNNDAKYSSAFRAIINSQDEIKAILLSTVSISTNTHAFEQRYSGKIPDRYLYNEGFGGAFPCPYCGALEERAINDEQYCKCSVCGQKFLAVDLSLPVSAIDPFFEAKGESEQKVLNIITQKYGRNESDPLLATPERVGAWIRYHSVVKQERDLSGRKFVELINPYKYNGEHNEQKQKMESIESKFPEVCKKRNELLVIPYDKKYSAVINGSGYSLSGQHKLDGIKTLVFLGGIQYVDVEMLKKFHQLETVVFRPEYNPNQHKYAYSFINPKNKCKSKLIIPKPINVFGKVKDGNNIELIVEEKSV